jgi:hypothetical protein
MTAFDSSQFQPFGTEIMAQIKYGLRGRNINKKIIAKQPKLRAKTRHKSFCFALFRLSCSRFDTSVDAQNCLNRFLDALRASVVGFFLEETSAVPE